MLLARMKSLQKLCYFALLQSGIFVLAAGLAGCRSPTTYRRDADRVAYDITGRAGERAFGRKIQLDINAPTNALRQQLLLEQELPHSGPASFGVAALKPIAHWPEKKSDEPAEAAAPDEIRPDDIMRITLAEALRAAARNNRDYRSRKEEVFQAALALDLEANAFRNLFFADAESDYNADYSGENSLRGLVNTGSFSWKRRLTNGAMLTTRFAVDLVKLLTFDRSSSLGLFADATISAPLLRGAGRYVVAEPLTQAEQNMLYALCALEYFKQTLAVRVASEYLSVLQQLDQTRNAEDNYRRVAESTRRVKRMADAGRLPRIQVDQALQDELRARDRCISSGQTFARRLDAIKLTLGLPADAMIDLDYEEMQRLTSMVSFERENNEDFDDDSTLDDPLPPMLTSDLPEIKARQAIIVALEQRLDLRIALGRVFDAQRKVTVAADALRAGLTLEGRAAMGERRTLSSADLPFADLRPEKGAYNAGLALDLPLERTSERNLYRNSLIALEKAAREAQALEDNIKMEVRDAMRAMLQARESYRIQQQALTVALRRVASTEQFLQAGRAEVRDILEAQEALVSARNALTASKINYHLAALQLQRDMGVLTVDDDGNYHEYKWNTENTQ